jgi:hypothetical protein
MVEEKTTALTWIEYDIPPATFRIVHARASKLVEGFEVTGNPSSSTYVTLHPSTQEAPFKVQLNESPNLLRAPGQMIRPSLGRSSQAVHQITISQLPSILDGRCLETKHARPHDYDPHIARPDPV